MSLSRRISERVRRLWPERIVHRDVQGVRLELPWSHRLPDYAERFPTYGQNLVAVAERVGATTGGSFGMVDVGANVGDSALQVLAAIDARVLCVEGDRYWLRFLDRNVARDSRITVVPALVLVDADPEELGALRRNGTTQFVRGEHNGDTAATISPSALRETAENLGSVRLIKSDTDGYDVAIVPALARAWNDQHPVLFFEYDPAITRKVGDDRPDRVWSELAALGYDHVVVWDNFGGGLGHLSVLDAAEAAAVLDESLDVRGYHYWDVAVVHRDDAALRASLDVLVGDRPFDAKAERGR